MGDRPDTTGGRILRALGWGAIAAVAWVVGMFVVTGAWGYVFGWKADEFWGGTRPPGWNAAADRAMITTIFAWIPLSPLAFVVGAMVSCRRRPGGKPPGIEE